MLELAQQDLILRVAHAYFDVLLAQFTIELTESQKKAVVEPLAQAKRNFEVGVATITDTNEAQAKYDQIVAQEIAARNDYDNKVTALRAIIGRYAQGVEARRSRASCPSRPTPTTCSTGSTVAHATISTSGSPRRTTTSRRCEIDQAKAGHYPTLDLVASYNHANSSGARDQPRRHQLLDDTGTIGVQLAVPLYQGGFVDSTRARRRSRCRTRRGRISRPRGARRFTLAQTGYTGVASARGVGQGVRAGARVGRSRRYQSNKLGQEVGVRTNLDVLNVQQNVYSTRRDLAQAYFNYLIGALRLKAAVGTLTDRTSRTINRQLRG